MTRRKPIKPVTLESLDKDIQETKQEVDNLADRVDKLENPTETVKIVTVKCDIDDLPPRTKRVQVEYQYIPKTLEDYSIDEIARISESGKAREYGFKEGDTKKIKIGKDWYDATIIALDHYKDESGKPLGITFGVTLPCHIMNDLGTNKGGYPCSDLREHLKNVYINDFPKEWKKHIKETPIKCYVDNLGMIPIHDPLFIPSAYEIFGDNISSEKEGMGYWKDYYSKYSTIHKQEGTPIPYLYEHRAKGEWYWTRSSSLSDSRYLWYVNADGDLIYSYASHSYGVALCWSI